MLGKGGHALGGLSFLTATGSNLSIKGPACHRGFPCLIREVLLLIVQESLASYGLVLRIFNLSIYSL